MAAKYPKLYDEKKVRFGKLSSDKDILLLFDKIFGRKFDSTLTDWFSQCPAGPNRWYGAFNGDEPVAMYGLLPAKFSVGGRELLCGICNNVGVVPEYQGKGLFQSIGEYALGDSKFPISIGIPNAKSVRGHKRIGWRTFGELELLGRNRKASGPDFVGFKDFKYFPTGRDNKYFHPVRTIDYLKWRYSKPGFEYFQTVVGNNYAVWKVYQDRKQIVEITDVSLIEAFSGDVDVWSFKGSRDSEKLKHDGFIPVMSNEFILFTEMDLKAGPDEYIFELGDNDVF